METGVLAGLHGPSLRDFLAAESTALPCSRLFLFIALEILTAIEFLRLFDIAAVCYGGCKLEVATTQAIIFFLVPVFAVTWTLCIALRPAAAHGELWAILAWLFPTVWSPTVVALILARRSGVRGEIRRRLRYSRGSGGWLLAAAAVPALATMAAVLGSRTAGDAEPFIPSAAIPMMIVLQLLTGAVGEELGWRGFLLPRLTDGFGQMTAGWVMGVLWSLWHVAGHFFPGTPQHDLIPFLPGLLFAIVFGVFLAFLFNRTNESILATMIAHLSLNISLGAGGVRLSSLVFWWTMVGIYGATAFFISISSHKWKPLNMAGAQTAAR
jgi:membrane protease YdiL (CAAX protease family)